MSRSYLLINLENNDIEGSSHDLNGPQVQLGSAGFSQVQVVLTVKNYAGLGLFIVNDIVSFGHQK